VLPSSLLENMASIKDGSSRGENARLITRAQAGVLRFKRRKNRRPISTWYGIGKGELKVYRSQIQGLWRRLALRGWFRPRSVDYVFEERHFDLIAGVDIITSLV
jgi:hypothetical protein